MLIKETQLKTTLRCCPDPPPPIKLAEIQNLITHSAGKTIKKWIFSCNAGGGINVYKIYANLFFKTVRITKFQMPMPL